MSIKWRKKTPILKSYTRLAAEKGTKGLEELYTNKHSTQAHSEYDGYICKNELYVEIMMLV